MRPSSLPALASLREIVCFFAASVAVGHTLPALAGLSTHMISALRLLDHPWRPPEPGGEFGCAESSAQGLPTGSKIRRQTAKIPPAVGHLVHVCLPHGWVIARLLRGKLCRGGNAQDGEVPGVGCQVPELTMDDLRLLRLNADS